MTSCNNSQTKTHVAIPPIPLVSGDVFTDASGVTHEVDAVTLHMVGRKGDLQVVRLEYRFGGWWAPVGV